MVFLTTESPLRLITLMRGSGACDLAMRIAAAQGMRMQWGDAIGESAIALHYCVWQIRELSGLHYFAWLRPPWGGAAGQ